MILSMARNVAELLLLFLAARQDYIDRKIPNILILTGVVSGMIIGLIGDGAAFLQNGTLQLSKILSVAEGNFVGFAIGYLFWKMHVFKAGDAKLIWMIGALEGFSGFWMSLAAAIIAGGILSFFMMCKYGVLKERMLRVIYHIQYLVMTRSFEAYRPVEKDTLRMPFAVSAFVGIAFWKMKVLLGR